MRTDQGICLYLFGVRLQQETKREISYKGSDMRKYAYAYSAAPTRNKQDYSTMANRLLEFVGKYEPEILQGLLGINIGRFYGRAYVDLSCGERTVRFYDSPDYAVRMPLKNLDTYMDMYRQNERLVAYYDALASLYGGNKKLEWGNVDKAKIISMATDSIQEMFRQYDTPDKVLKLFAVFLGALNVYQICFSKEPVYVKPVNAALGLNISGVPGFNNLAPGDLISCTISRTSTISSTILCTYGNG